MMGLCSALIYNVGAQFIDMERAVTNDKPILFSTALKNDK